MTCCSLYYGDGAYDNLNNGFQRCPSFQTCDPDTLHGKKNVADGAQFRILRWGHYPGLSRWTPGNHSHIYKREVGGSELEKEMTTEAGVIIRESCFKRLNLW